MREPIRDIGGTQGPAIVGKCYSYPSPIPKAQGEKTVLLNLSKHCNQSRGQQTAVGLVIRGSRVRGCSPYQNRRGTSASLSLLTSDLKPVPPFTKPNRKPEDRRAHVMQDVGVSPLPPKPECREELRKDTERQMENNQPTEGT